MEGLEITRKAGKTWRVAESATVLSVDELDRIEFRSVCRRRRAD